MKMACNRGKNLAKRQGKNRFWVQDRNSVNDVDGWAKHGGYMNAKRKKLKDQFQSGAVNELQQTNHCSDIFKDVTIYINGYTKPSSDELKRLMMIHGGHWEMYMRKKNVTHVITTNLAHSKIAALENCKVVHPDWILKSIEAERLLPCQPFLLYSALSKTQKGIAQFSTSLPKTEASEVGLTHPEASRDSPLTETSAPSNNNNENSTEVEARSGPSELKVVHSGSSDDLFFSSSDNLSQESNQETKCKTNISIKNEVLSEAVSLSTVTKAPSMTKPTVTHTEDGPTLLVISSESEKEDEIVITDPVKKVDTLPPNNNNNNDSNNNTTTTLSTNTGVQQTGSSRAQTARDPNYLQQFYTNSRLHHLSTWKAEWKNYVNKLKSSNTKEFSGRQKLKDACSKVQSPSLADSIMHIDMDSFFVAVAMRDRPHLKDKPVAVTHSRKNGPKENNPGVNLDYERQQWSKRFQENALKKMEPNMCQRNNLALDEEFEDEEEGSGAEGKHEDLKNISNEKTHSVNKQSFNSLSEIASCNYVARQFGLKNGMFVGDALKLCPDIVTIPYEFDKYQAVSKILYDTIASYTHDIEAISCDEMFVDCSGILQETGVALKDFVSILRQEIFDKTGCTASAGLGPNILVARLATIRAKPDGQFLVEKHEVEAFMQKQLVKNLPGVGRSMMYKLQHLNVEMCQDLQKIPLVKLQQSFGQKTGQMLYNSCRGIDNRRLELEYNRKSVSAEINYGIRFTKESDMEDFLLNLSGEVERRLKNVNKRGKSITLKLMVRREDAPLETAKYMGHGLCNNISRAVSVAIATDNAARIARECMTLFKALHLPVNSLRGVGISIHRLEDTAPARHHTGDSTKTSSILQFTKAIPTPDQKKKQQKQQQQQQTQDEDVMLSQVDDSDFTIMRPVPVKQFGTVNFKEELLRQYHSSQLPPLPRLPSQLSPTRMYQMKPAVTGEPEDFLPSPSQVDENVLKELPDDIRNQIKTALEEKKAKRKTSAACGGGGGGGVTSNNITLAQDEQPGCSYWSETTISDENGQEADNAEEPIKENQNLSQIERELLPNLSQLDESCFNALPEDIQEEMKMAITDRQNRKNNMEADVQLGLPLLLSPSKVHLKPLSLMSPTKKSRKPIKKRSPSKKGSPLKKRSPTKRSPSFKVPQGRPKKIQRSLNNLSNIRKNLFLYGDHLHLKTKTGVREEEKKTEKELKEETEREKHCQPVSLCGAVTIEQVRSLLSEWLQPSRVPSIDDEQFVIKYLKDLIYSKNLEQLDLVLKFLYRKMRKLSTEDWWKSLKSIVDDVQCVMMAEYNSPLQLSFSIPVT